VSQPVSAQRIGSRQALWIVLAVVLLGLVLQSSAAVYRTSGLFTELGTDFAAYLSQARVLRNGGPDQIYEYRQLQREYEHILRSVNVSHTAHPVAQVPYPPLFAWLLGPLTHLPPAVSFALWTVLNVAATLYLAVRCAQVLRSPSWVLPVLLVSCSYPIVLTMALGQIQIWLACAVTEGYLAMRVRQDLRAGLWLGALVLKPQYLVLLFVVLLWHRRWHLLWGIGITAALVWLGSILTVGPEAVWAFPQAFQSMAPFRSDWPEAMINWRAMIFHLRPGIGDPAGLLLTAIAGLLTAVGALVLWRDGWTLDRPDFPAKLTVLLIATCLAAYHSHSYGTAVLLLPVAATWTTPYGSSSFRALVMAAMTLPTVILSAAHPLSLGHHSFFSRIPIAATVTLLTLMGAYTVLFVLLTRTRTPVTAPQSEPRRAV
jgi:hypothetical protein